MKYKMQNSNFFLIILISYSLFAFGFLKKIGSPIVDGYKTNNVIYLILILNAIVFLMRKKRKIILKLVVIMLGYIIYLTIKACISYNSQTFFSILLLISPMLMLFNIHEETGEEFNKQLKILLIFNLIYSIFSICEFYFYNSIAGYIGLNKTADYVTRHSTMLGSSITTSYYFLMNIPLNIVGIIRFANIKRWKNLFIIDIVLTTLAIILGQSRLAFVILGVYFIIYLFLFGNKIKLYKKIIIASVLVFLLIWILNNDSLSRLYSNYSENESTQTRYNIIDIGMELFEENPIIGTEISKYYKRIWTQEQKYVLINGKVSLVDPHNVYVFFLAEQGLIGAFMFLGIIIFLLREFIKYLPKNIKINYYILLIGQVLAYCGGSQLMNEINFSTIFWSYMVIFCSWGLKERMNCERKV